MAKTKKPTYMTYDLIRQNKFRTPEKILMVEKLLEENQCVINWWCRQSGKSLTSIKVARDLAVKQKSKIVFVAVKTVNANDLKTLMARCIDRDIVEKNDSEIPTSCITLKNGSCIYFISSAYSAHINDADLIVFDEFEYMSTPDFFSIVSHIRSSNESSLIKRFLNMFSFNNKKKFVDTKLLFSSSMKDRKNLDIIRKAFPTAPVTYMNYEKINYGPGRIDDIKKILSEKEFTTEYNSYFPQ